MITRRKIAATAGTLFALGATGLHAEDPYPHRPITLVVPFAAGGLSDLLGRKIAEGLSARIGASVVIDNRSGAGGNIGAQMVARAAPDGYTLLLGYSGPLAANTSLYGQLGYDPVADFTPIGFAAIGPLVLVVNAQMPFRTMAELIAYARAKPGELAFGHTGNGGPAHLAGELLSSVAKVQITEVAYRGTSQLMPDLLSGRVHACFDAIITAAPNIQAGKVRPLAVTTAERAAAQPDVPTMAEAGVPGVIMPTWYGIVAPARLPRDVQARLNRELNAVLADPAFVSWAQAQGMQPRVGTPDDFARYMAQETGRLGQIIRAANIKLS